jgi:hypothetical protein
MSGAARWTAGTALVLLTLMGFVLQSRTTREFTGGSHGTIPQGYGALFDVFDELELGPHRGHVTGLEPARTGWWVSSLGICRPRDAEPRAWDATPWVRRGGTAVLLLPERGQYERCALAGDLPLPHRRALRAGKGPHHLAGDVLRADRALRGRDLARFWKVRDPWRVRATLAGEPFVIERLVGEGRVVAVADGRILQNARLGKPDAALVGVDLVQAFGSPTFDEAVTARHARSTLSYVAASPALPLFLALGALGLVLTSHGRMVPPRRLDSDMMPEPRLDDLIDSLATLYARAGSATDALRHYRVYARASLRRHFGLPVDTPAALVADRAERHGAPPTVLALLRDDPGATTTLAPDHAMRALDAYLWKVTS